MGMWMRAISRGLCLWGGYRMVEGSDVGGDD